jgi:uncharacterized SAM-binding protein YcdF (DUF218 family)
MYAVLSKLSEPFTAASLLTALVILWLWVRSEMSRRRLFLLTFAFAGVFLPSLPCVSYLLVGSLEWQNPPQVERPADAKALVVLSGGALRADDVRPFDQLSPDTLYRCIHAARLYHAGEPLPVVVSGGRVDPNESGPSLAAMMQRFLMKLNVDEQHIVLEEESRSTYENAVHSTSLLEARGINHIVLVTEATHMPRSLACFRAQGLQVTPSGCDYRATSFDARPADFLPDARTVSTSQHAAHEWIGTLWYWLKGRI